MDLSGQWHHVVTFTFMHINRHLDYIVTLCLTPVCTLYTYIDINCVEPIKMALLTWTDAIHLQNLNLVTSALSVISITAHLWGESTGHRWIPLTNASDMGVLMFSLICAWTNGWSNNWDASELRSHQIEVPSHSLCHHCNGYLSAGQAWGQIHICIWFLSGSVFAFDWKWCICIIFGGESVFDHNPAAGEMLRHDFFYFFSLRVFSDQMVLFKVITWSIDSANLEWILQCNWSYWPLGDSNAIFDSTSYLKLLMTEVSLVK